MLTEAIIDYLEDEGVGVKGTDLFESVQPTEQIECSTVYDTGGFEPDNELPRKDPTIQIISRAGDYATAKQKALDIYDKLHKTANVTIGAYYIYLITAMQEPASIGRDEADNFEISCNYRIKVRE